MKIAVYRKTLILTILSCFVLLNTAAWSVEEHGIDRIDPVASRYAYFSHWPTAAGVNYTGYGYKVRSADYVHQGRVNFRNLEASDGVECIPKEGIIFGTLTGDIRDAILDRDKFDVALVENRFVDAWNMGGDTEQGRLWKRLAFSRTKNALSQLVRAAVFEDNLNKTIQARAISDSFPQPTARELNDFIEEENASARTILENLVPDTAARLAALRTIADRLFE